MSASLVTGSPGTGAFTSVTGPTFTLSGYTPVEGHVIWLTCQSFSTATGEGVLPSDWHDCGAGPRSAGDASMAARSVYHVVTAAEELAGTNTWEVPGVFATAETGNWHALAIQDANPADPIDAYGMVYDEDAATTTAYLAGLAGADLATDSKVFSAIVADNAARTFTTPSGWTQHNSGNQWIGSRDALTVAGIDVPATAITISTADETISYSIAVNAASVVEPVLVAVDPAGLVLGGQTPTVDSGATMPDVDPGVIIPQGQTPGLTGAGGTTIPIDAATLTLTGWAGPTRQLTAALFDLAMTRRLFFGHQSVGAQVLTGIGELASDLGRPDPVEVHLPADPIPPTGGMVSDAYVGLNGDGFTKTRGDHTVGEPTAEPSFAQRIVELQDDIDTAVLKFCYADLRPGSTHYAIGPYTPTMLFNEYKTTFAGLEAAFPHITFIYATETIVNVDDEDSINGANALRMQFNQLIRAEYGDTGRLWDIALAESTDPDGDRYIDGDGSEYLYIGYASGDLEHISGVDGIGRKAAATPLVLILADIATAESEPVLATVDPATLSLTGETPAMGTGAAGSVVDPAALALSGLDATFAGSGTAGTSTDPAALGLAGQETALTGSSAVPVVADTGALVLVALTPVLVPTGTAAAVDPAALTLGTLTPAVVGTGQSLVAADPAALALAGQTPVITAVLIGPWRDIRIHTGPAISRTIHPGRTL